MHYVRNSGESSGQVLDLFITRYYEDGISANQLFCSKR